MYKHFFVFAVLLLAACGSEIPDEIENFYVDVCEIDEIEVHETAVELADVSPVTDDVPSTKSAIEPEAAPAVAPEISYSGDVTEPATAALERALSSLEAGAFDVSIRTGSFRGSATHNEFEMDFSAKIISDDNGRVRTFFETVTDMGLIFGSLFAGMEMSVTFYLTHENGELVESRFFAAGSETSRETIENFGLGTLDFSVPEINASWFDGFDVTFFAEHGTFAISADNPTLPIGEPDYFLIVVPYSSELPKRVFVEFHWAQEEPDTFNFFHATIFINAMGKDVQIPCN
ncbi:MAG: hypothetical protein FWC70_04010 [Defluviitaleaceae bacterium]|nr:hypothetical protein [Defluviitaleaceae bacterium]